VSIITHDDVRRAMLIDSMNADEISTLNDILIPRAEAEMEGYLHRPLIDGTMTEHYVMERDAKFVYLTRTPVVSVESVSIFGQVLDPLAFVVRTWGLEFVNWLATAGPTFPMRMWGPVEVDVTWTYSTIYGQGGVVRSIVMQRVERDFAHARLMASMDAQNSLGLTALSVEGYSATFAPPRGLPDTDAQGGYTGDEIRAVRRFRHRVMR